MEFISTNEIGYGCVIDENFFYHFYARTILYFEKPLRKYCYHCVSELHSYLILFTTIKRIYDTRYRLMSTSRMKRRENQVSRLSKCQGCFYFFFISHFPKEYDLRILSHRSCESHTIIWYILPYFFLFDDRNFMLVYIFYRIFYRDDMFFIVAVDKIYHRCQCRCLTRTSWSSYEYESLTEFTYIFVHFCEPESIYIWYARVEESEYHHIVSHLKRYIGSKSTTLK